MNNDRQELIDLIYAYLDGRATEEQATRLNATLRADEASRDLYLKLADIHSCLAVEEGLWVGQLAGKNSSDLKVRPTPRPWPSWRPIAAAAAGIGFGIFCTSVVFAYAVPRMRLDRQRVIPILNDGFEDVKAAFGRGFPNDAGGWSGDFATVVAMQEAVVPKEGQHMVRLAPLTGRKFCAAARIVDLAEFPILTSMESWTVEVTASFHGSDPAWADRNQIRLAAFSEPPRDVKAIWNGDNRLDQALQHLGQTVPTKPGESGWQTLKVSMVIPAGARSLVIHLGAGAADDAGPKTPHYIDDVHVRFLIKESTP
jgi:hypothetical protein